MAAGLRGCGVRAGDRVLIHLENCPEFLLAWFGGAALGAVAVTTNARSAADELRYYASDSELVGAITQPRFAGLVTAAAPQLNWRFSLDADPAGPPSHWQPGRDESWAALAGDPDTVPPRPAHLPHQRRPARAGRAELAGRSGRRSFRRRSIGNCG